MTAKTRAESAVLDADALPDKWEPAPVHQHVGDPGVPEYCGVTVRPKPVRAKKLNLYARRSTGPFILQYTYVSTKGAATSVLRRLGRAADGCRSDKGDHATFTVHPIRNVSDVGDRAVGLRYLPHDGIPSKVMVFRRSEVVVVLVGYGLPQVPVKVLRSVATAVDARLT